MAGGSASHWHFEARRLGVLMWQVGKRTQKSDGFDVEVFAAAIADCEAIALVAFGDGTPLGRSALAFHGRGGFRLFANAKEGNASL